MAWKWLLFAGMSAMIISSYLLPAPQPQIGVVSRIFYYHVPQAWVCVIAFAMSMVFSVRYLRSRSLIDDDRAVAAASLGFVFCVLATVTGSIYSRVTWGEISGQYWNWDPRQTSILVLLLIYGAYFTLRSAIEVVERRAALSAAYAIFAFVTVPFLVFVVPRVMPSLHPEDSIINENLELTMGPAVRVVFFLSLTLFTALYLWMFSMARRVRTMSRLKMEDV